jgi:hypothetical protein
MKIMLGGKEFPADIKHEHSLFSQPQSHYTGIQVQEYQISYTKCRLFTSAGKYTVHILL